MAYQWQSTLPQTPTAPNWYQGLKSGIGDLTSDIVGLPKKIERGFESALWSASMLPWAGGDYPNYAMPRSGGPYNQALSGTGAQYGRTAKDPQGKRKLFGDVMGTASQLSAYGVTPEQSDWFRASKSGEFQKQRLANVQKSQAELMAGAEQARADLAAKQNAARAGALSEKGFGAEAAALSPQFRAVQPTAAAMYGAPKPPQQTGTAPTFQQALQAYQNEISAPAAALRPVSSPAKPGAAMSLINAQRRP